MNAKRTAVVAWHLAVGLTLGLAVSPAQGKDKPQPNVLDEGKLDKSWFGAEVEFREADEIDYFWVRPGFSPEGKTLHFVDWPEPVFLGEGAHKRDTKDMRLAQEMNSGMAEVFDVAFANAFQKRLATSRTRGDVLVEGRIVDCSTGAVAAKVLVGFGAGSGSTTIDLRFKDATSGELLAALHHRVVSGTTWSTTDSKFVNCVDEIVDEFAKKGMETLYKKGDRVREYLAAVGGVRSIEARAP